MRRSSEDASMLEVSLSLGGGARLEGSVQMSEPSAFNSDIALVGPRGLSFKLLRRHGNSYWAGARTNCRQKLVAS